MKFGSVNMAQIKLQSFILMLLIEYLSSLALPKGEVIIPKLFQDPHGEMVLRFFALGKEIELHLVPDDAFLVPGLQIQYVGKAGLDEEEMNGLRSCFYSSREPLAAISLCKGIQGAFLYDQAQYVIQPLDKWESRDRLGEHLIFKAGDVSTQRWESKSGEQIYGGKSKEWEHLDIDTNQQQNSQYKYSQNMGNTGESGQSYVTKAKHTSQHMMSPHVSKRPQSQHEGSDNEKHSKMSPKSLDTWSNEEGPKNERTGGARNVHPLRHRRFVSEDRFVEILLVADTSMVKFYGEDLKLHLLTLMSVAARIYKHPSLRNSVSLVVVKVLVVENEEAGPEVSDNGGLTLRNFCNWQQKYNPTSDRHAEHYDTAILLTRQDICGHESCETVGVADIGTVCDPSKSCSVIEDEGVQAAYTLAHELGHVLSIPHDNSKNCEKLFGEQGENHLMADLFVQLNKSVPWSPCSALHLTDFFDNGYGDCLLDAPSNSMELPVDLPGTSNQYNLDSQCRQVFGEGFIHCPNTRQEDICAQLWCRVVGEHVCHTKNGSLHWADGTVCGVRRVCLDGACLEENDVLKPKMPVDGNWGSWSDWGECSRSCGGGVHFSYRECNNPEPQNGGKYCKGQRAMYESCNTRECLPQEQSFREQQCAKYNSYNFTDREGNLIEWIPKYSGVFPRDRCKLFCRARGRSEFKVFQSKVLDGTLCGPETLSVCVQGQCIKAGCDHILGSSKKLDKCAVCGGNGMSCKKISGSLNKSKYGYTDIVHIPAGATNIDIKQRSHRGISHDSIYLAIKRMDGSYLLNGDFAVSSMEQDLHLRGTILKYSGSMTTLERIQSIYPLPETLIIQLLCVVGEAVPPKVKYTFFIPKNLSYERPKPKEKISHHFLRPLLTSQWFLGDWAPCSKSCGFGWQRRTVECRDMDGGSSDHCSQELRPEDVRPCGDLPCPIWRVGSWSPCSHSCGEGVRTQRVFCIDYAGKETDSNKCDPGKRPTEAVTPCMLKEC
ncbi:A disintegrin and metalloproteinase with thrombospondin motifs 8 [Bombina bombina]|uniref:A disintegrin and metalloproteinase with thrombospondin motifs 8 n=1 Tax=Bombina bombina TaxID=8345 RepID=UPI00235A6C00|nr:A disintegrin and metalloproteinase with thrombospondin motifs 8 [Bombina bombina]